MTDRTLTLALIGDSLGYAHTTTVAVDLDWSEAAGENADGWEVILPHVSYDVLKAHAPDLLEGVTLPPDMSAAVEEDLSEAFDQADGRDDWIGDFDPMMSYAWPVMLRYGVDAQDLADLLEEFAPSCTLISFDDSSTVGEEYAFALNGGGMNLSDQLAAAYLCAGHVPPAKLLSGLSGVISKRKRDQLGEVLREAFAMSAQAFRLEATRMEEECARMYAPDARLSA